MGPWSEHGTAYYNCNRFDQKSGTDARDAQAKSRQSLERYLHVGILLLETVPLLTATVL
jgi:ariadne-1